MEVLKESLCVDTRGAAVTRRQSLHNNRKWSSNRALLCTLPGIQQGQVQGLGLCWNWPGEGNATNQTTILYVLKVTHTRPSWCRHPFDTIAPCSSFWNHLQGELWNIRFSDRLFCLLLAKVTFKGIYYDVIKLKEKYACYKKLDI